MQEVDTAEGASRSPPAGGNTAGGVGTILVLGGVVGPSPTCAAPQAHMQVALLCHGVPNELTGFYCRKNKAGFHSHLSVQ